jgi:hypothetical protein
MPGGGGREPLVADLVQWFGVAAFLCGGDQPWRTGAAGAGAASLTWVRGAWRCPGDMMIDWVSPACGDAAAQSNQAVRVAP